MISAEEFSARAKTHFTRADKDGNGEITKQEFIAAKEQWRKKRYGNKPIAVVDNKSTIEVGPMDKLPKVIDMVIEAVSAGELDKVLKAALGERRVKLRQVS